MDCACNGRGRGKVPGLFVAAAIRGWGAGAGARNGGVSSGGGLCWAIGQACRQRQAAQRLSHTACHRHACGGRSRVHEWLSLLQGTVDQLRGRHRQPCTTLAFRARHHQLHPGTRRTRLTPCHGTSTGAWNQQGRAQHSNWSYAPDRCSVPHQTGSAVSCRLLDSVEGCGCDCGS